MCNCVYHSSYCIDPKECCDEESSIKCLQALRIKSALENPCPRTKGKCDIPQCRAYMNNPSMCNSSDECPLKDVRKKLEPADFDEDIIYPKGFIKTSMDKIYHLIRANGL